MTTFQAKITAIKGKSEPDEYNPSFGLRPPCSFVICRDVDGVALSCYGDIAWNRTPYGTKQEGSWLYFDFWRARHAAPNIGAALADLSPRRSSLLCEIRWLMFILIYLRPGSALSNGTLDRYCILICTLARICEAKNCSIEQLLSEKRDIIDFSRCFPNQAGNLAALLKLLKWLGSKRAGFDVVDDQSITAVRLIARDHVQKNLQTPPLPTRIYSHVLSALGSEILEFEGVVDRLLAMLEACSKDRLLGRATSQQRRLIEQANGWRPEFSEMLRDFGLEEFWKKKGYKLKFQSLFVVLIELMGFCYLQIQAFTGMRFNEVSSLPHFCYQEVVADGQLHHIVLGRVTKLTRGKIKRVQWVTSEAGRRAITLAQRVSGAIYALAGETPKPSRRRICDFHLFVSPTFCLPSARGGRNCPPTLDLSKPGFERLRAVLEAKITADDLSELELVDPERDWSKDFPVNSPWPLASHQLRRSLALYAHASGIVTLPSLKRQLQHITREMSLYYARGSQFSKDFIAKADFEETHFGEEWQETIAESEYLGYKINVERGNPDEMAGAYGLWFNRNIGSKNILLDRKETLADFRKGKRAYRATFAGGCVKVGACEKRLSDPMNLECLLNDCKNQLIKLPKFERVIRIQAQLVEDLAANHPELPETRVEREILANLEKRLIEIRQSKLTSRAPR